MRRQALSLPFFLYQDETTPGSYRFMTKKRVMPGSMPWQAAQCKRNLTKMKVAFYIFMLYYMTSNIVVRLVGFTGSFKRRERKQTTR
jgi:hypothetical protein